MINPEIVRKHPIIFQLFYLLFVGNGQIDFKEFLLMMARQANNKSDEEQELRESFKVRYYHNLC